MCCLRTASKDPGDRGAPSSCSDQTMLPSLMVYQPRSSVAGTNRSQLSLCAYWIDTMVTDFMVPPGGACCPVHLDNDLDLIYLFISCRGAGSTSPRGLSCRRRVFTFATRRLGAERKKHTAHKARGLAVISPLRQGGSTLPANNKYA